MATPRMIFAVGLAALVFASGCGSKPEPTLPDVKLDDATPLSPPPPPTSPTPSSDPNAPPPKVEAPKTAWEIDQTKHVIPAAPVKGSIAGVEVTPAVQIEGAELTFQVFKAGTPVVDRSLKLNFAPALVAGQPPPQFWGRGWKVKLDTDPGPNVPHVWVELPGKMPYWAPSGYALTLELGARKDGKVAGKIYLSLMDDQKTVLAGTFDAVYSRSYSEPPGPDDAPYIGGEVTVTGAQPGAEVRVAYFASTTTAGVFFKELQLGCTSEIVVLPDPDKSTRPRASQLVSGDGKGRPFRYEHVKLAPGRYLISAAVVGGPVVWKWVELPPGGALTENLALDATKTGSVEVSVPAGVKGKVFLAPADDPARPALELDVFVAVAFQVVRQDGDIVSGKALVKNLAPGKYEVRAGELRGAIEIVAGKTAEMTLVPPKK